MQSLGQVPEGCGAEAEVRSGFGKLRCRGWGPEGFGADAEVSFRRVLVQNLGEIPESFGADAEVSFWLMWHCLSHFAFHYVNHVMIWI